MPVNYATVHTSRYVLKYKNNGGTHNVMFRWWNYEMGDGNILLDNITAFFNSIKPLLYNDCTFLSAIFYPAGSNTSQDVAIPTQPATSSLVQPDGYNRANQATWVGRDNEGVQSRLSIMGVRETGLVSIPAIKNCRIEYNEDPIVGLSIDALNALDTSSIGRKAVVWKKYINFAQNKYLVKQVRQSV